MPKTQPPRPHDDIRAQRDREWEAALADAFNRYDVEPPRPPLTPEMVSVWASRVRAGVVNREMRLVMGRLEDTLNDIGALLDE